MNIFVLSTGHCGSTTFERACSHITNFDSGHETRSHMSDEQRYRYPDNHIESDNHLSWLLGRLDEEYGDNAVYVHLIRNEYDTAMSFSNRYEGGIIRAFREDIIQNTPSFREPIEVSRDYYRTVNSNISLFLKDKTQKNGISFGGRKIRLPQVL